MSTFFSTVQRLSASLKIAESRATSRLTKLVCAQRLSASLKIAVSPLLSMKEEPAVCSTPFGITENCGIDAALYYDIGLEVLNAFRHH